MKLCNLFSCCNPQKRLHKKLSKKLMLDLDQQQQLSILLTEWQATQDTFHQRNAFGPLFQKDDFEQAAAQQLELNIESVQRFNEALITFNKQLSDAQQTQLKSYASQCCSFNACKACC